MTIYWIGDLAHQGGTSGHNPDDYAGVRAEMLDADSDPEVRALDFMVGPKFTVQDGRNLVNALIRGADKNRLYYVIYRSTIYRRATGFKPEPYGGANHEDHVHASGHVNDDANGADWRSVLALGEEIDLDARQDQMLRAISARVEALVTGKAQVTTSWSRATPNDTETQWEVAQLAQLRADVNELTKALREIKAALASTPPSGGTG